MAADAAETIGRTRIGWVDAPGGGRIAVMPCPGTPYAGGRLTAEATVRALADLGMGALLSLIEHREFTREGLSAEHFGALVRHHGMAWAHLPMQDGSVPGNEWELAWRDNAAPMLHRALDAGQAVGVHCMGGLGRSGIAAVRLLVERGRRPEDALKAVRAARHGAVENPRQEACVLSLTPGRPRP